MAYNGKKPRHTQNYKDPVCDTCQNAEHQGGGNVACVKRGVLVRKEWAITPDFFACLAGDYKREAAR